MEKFTAKEGRYEITADQKSDLLNQLREELSLNGHSKEGIVHKTKIGDQLHMVKNRGSKANPIWNFKPISQINGERNRRENRKTYFSDDTKAEAKSLKFKDKAMADEAAMLDLSIYEEHQHSLDAPQEHLWFDRLRHAPARLHRRQAGCHCCGRHEQLVQLWRRVLVRRSVGEG